MTFSKGTPFEPAWWCRGAHAQTLWSSVFRWRPHIELQRERLELADGDFIDLDWTCNADSPVVIVLHGLEGSSRSPYVRGLLKVLQQQGFRGVVMHFRGCSGAPNRLARGYHSGDTGDLANLVTTLRRREPHTPLTAVGYSLGGNVLLKWLGETGTAAQLQAAVAVSVPFLLGDAADRIAQGFSRVYQWKLLASMRRAIRRKLALMPMNLGTSDLSSLHNFRLFDEHVTAPLHGFRNAEHYYACASSRRYLKHITVDTLVLHARDDPFMTEAVIPLNEELSPNVALELYRNGGHVGFVSGQWPWHAHYWLEERISAYLLGHLESKQRS
ncbi:MAG: hydrolase [Acidiferrobacterales bacterium]